MTDTQIQTNGQSNAPWFKHDSNARHDPKMKALRRKYGMAGYGRFWVLCELLRDEHNYMVEYKPYNMSALADDFGCEVSEAEEFIKDCIEDFELLNRSDDGKYFYSPSLLRRMRIKDEALRRRSELGRKAAEARWKGKKKTGSMSGKKNDKKSIPRKSATKKADLPDYKRQCKHLEQAEKLYQAYPKKVKPADAFKAIDKALKQKTDEMGSLDKAYEYLFSKTKQFAKSPKGNRGKYTPYPATWFNGAEYDSDPATWNEEGKTGAGESTNQRPGPEYLTRAEAADDAGKRGVNFDGENYERRHIRGVYWYQRIT